MARSSVSADISKHVVWINSTDLKSTIKAVKIHEILIDTFGFVDGFFLGVVLPTAVCSYYWLI